MRVPVGLNVWSRVEELFPYVDEVVAPFDSLWFPDHVQYDGHKVAEGWRLLTVHFADAPRPDGTQLFAAAVLPHVSTGGLA